MKKILFEQIGNIIMVILFVAALIQTLLLSRLSDAKLFIAFGPLWFICIAYIVLFMIARYLFSKSKMNGGYNKKKGEFSSEDEREEIIVNKSVRHAYYAVIIFLFASCGVVCVLGLLTNDFQLFKITCMILFGGAIISAFLTYMISWIYLDAKD